MLTHIAKISWSKCYLLSLLNSFESLLSTGTRSYDVSFLPDMQSVSRHCIMNGSSQYLNNFQSLRSSSPVSHCTSSTAFSPRFIHPDLPTDVCNEGSVLSTAANSVTSQSWTSFFGFIYPLTNILIRKRFNFVETEVSMNTHLHRTIEEAFDICQLAITDPGITTQF